MTNYNSKIFSFIVFLICHMVQGQSEIIPLWNGNMPNHIDSDEVEVQNSTEILRISKVQTPTLEVFLPAKRSSNGKAVIICPGGAYTSLSYDWEGTDVAKWFNAQGVAAFVLKYRLPQSASIGVQHEAPLQDAQRALRLVRHDAGKWNINRDKIGIMGFSAGGHLASSLGVHYDYVSHKPNDDIDTLSARPDFMVLIYPVITMKGSAIHKGSKSKLLGTSPSDELVDFFSNELHVNKNTPPTFLVHATDDKAVPVDNSLMFYKGLKDADVLAEMHIYPNGGHGFGLATGKGYLQSWTYRLADWLKNFDN